MSQFKKKCRFQNSLFQHLFVFLGPHPVTDLSATVSAQDITLSWQPGVNSTQDRFYIWFRPMLNSFVSAQWKQAVAINNHITLKGMFAGERYELILFAVSITEMSMPRNVFAEVGKRLFYS